MRRFHIITIVALTVLIYPYVAKADIEALQPIQGKLSVLQQKAKEAQEKLMEYKKKLEEYATQARKYKEQAEGMKEGIDAASKGDFSKMNNIAGPVSEGIVRAYLGSDKEDKGSKKSSGDTKGAMKDTEKVAASVEENVVPKTDGGDTTEKAEEAQEFIQEMMRDAVSTLYSVGFTTRTELMKEKPHDVDMEAKDQILLEINMKAQECIFRTARIHSLQSLQKSYLMIGEMQSVIYESEDEEDEGEE